MKQLIEAIEGMVAVEEAAQHCPDCVVGAFCPKHDEAFWDYWTKVKRHLSNQSSGQDNAEPAHGHGGVVPGWGGK